MSRRFDDGWPHDAKERPAEFVSRGIEGVQPEDLAVVPPRSVARRRRPSGMIRIPQ
jgi:hypothetical protein